VGLGGDVGSFFIRHISGTIWGTIKFSVKWKNLEVEKSIIPSEKIYHPKRRAVFQPSFFRGYVKLREGRSSTY